jgi:hypothetical protein
VNAIPTDDPELAEIVAMLRTVDADAPPAWLDVEDLLGRARRSERRRRAGWWSAGLAGVAAASLAVAVPSLVRVEDPAGVAVSGGPVVATSSATVVPPPPAPAVSLPSVFGPDWSTTGTVPGGFGGDLVLVETSPTAAGLPVGYRAAVRAITSPPEYSSIDGFCAPTTEKSMTASGCRDVTLADGTVVHRVDMDAPNGPEGTWATLRLLYQRPDGVLQIVDVVVSHVGGPTTAAQRSAAAAWMERQLAATGLAVTRVQLPVLVKS